MLGVIFYTGSMPRPLTLAAGPHQRAKKFVTPTTYANTVCRTTRWRPTAASCSSQADTWQAVRPVGGRHNMPRPQQVVTWRATQNVQVGSHRSCRWCGSSYSIRLPSLKLVCLSVGLPVPKIWLIFGHGVNRLGDLDLWFFFDFWIGSRVPVSWASLILPIFSFLCPSVHNLGSISTGQMDRQTTAVNTWCPHRMGWGMTNASSIIAFAGSTNSDQVRIGDEAASKGRSCSLLLRHRQFAV